MKTPSIKISLLPILTLLLLLGLNIYLFKDAAAAGPNQIALLITCALTTVIGVFYLKIPYERIEKSILENLNYSLHAIIILLVVGSLISIWIMSGIVPCLIYYGLKILSPTIFLPASCVICAVVSLATGSSWSTTGTIGIALMGIGQSQGISPGIVAGSIISGAYLGDKMSPLSDTTNLAPAMAGVDLFTHIKHMVQTSVPAFILSLIIFSLIGIFGEHNLQDSHQVDQLIQVLDTHFNLGLHILIIPLFVFILVIKKMPALPALVLATSLAALSIPIFQKDLLHSLFIQYNTQSAYKMIIQVAANGLSLETHNNVVNQLINRGGMVSMLNTVWLIIAAMIFGGVMEGTKMLDSLAVTLLQKVKKSHELIMATVASCIGTNILACDQYISIVLPGRIFKSSFEKFNIEGKYLSRTLEDAGTVTGVLIPWNSCGAYHAGILGISTFTYMPYCFFNILSPCMAILLAYLTFSKKLINQKDLHPFDKMNLERKQFQEIL